MPKILTIEDDESLTRNITHTLAASGSMVDVACTGREGMAKAMAGDYDVVTLARSLPDLDGLTILTTMRGVGVETRRPTQKCHRFGSKFVNLPKMPRATDISSSF
jgi:two-component system OmpR family response regulator